MASPASSDDGDSLLRGAALCSAATALCTGLGVPEDFDRAFLYFQAAAEAGDTAAMCNLARCHRLGIGTRRDLSTAVAWLERARDAGFTSANEDIAEIAAGGPTPPGGSEDEGSGGASARGSKGRVGI